MPPRYELHLGTAIAAVLAVIATAILIWFGL
jgi:hypothetical protein